MKILYIRRTENMWRDFKHDLKKSNESCPSGELKSKRDKSLSKDDCDILIEYWASKEEHIVYFCFVYLFYRNNSNHV